MHWISWTFPKEWLDFPLTCIHIHLYVWNKAQQFLPSNRTNHSSALPLIRTGDIGNQKFSNSLCRNKPILTVFLLIQPVITLFYILSEILLSLWYPVIDIIKWYDTSCITVSVVLMFWCILFMIIINLSYNRTKFSSVQFLMPPV